MNFFSLKHRWVKKVSRFGTLNPSKQFSEHRLADCLRCKHTAVMIVLLVNSWELNFECEFYIAKFYRNQLKASEIMRILMKSRLSDYQPFPETSAKDRQSLKQLKILKILGDLHCRKISGRCSIKNALILCWWTFERRNPSSLLLLDLDQRVPRMHLMRTNLLRRNRPV